ncbi:MAG: hypothetical protein V7K56_11475 [Nostoc sp.]
MGDQSRFGFCEVRLGLSLWRCVSEAVRRNRVCLIGLGERSLSSYP